MTMFQNAPDVVKQSAFIFGYLYLVMGGFHWIQDKGWFQNVDLCGWYGVDCIFLSIISSLQLPANGMQGTLPTILGRLQDLRTLDFSKNVNITGPIPSEIAGMTTLTELNLYNTSLTGTIPSALAGLVYMDSLQLNNNFLTGTIPTDIFGFPILRFLNLAHNRLGGSIPSEIGHATRLNMLRLQGNDLTGTLPIELQQQTSLELLNLGDGNQFHGTIPEFLGYMSRLQFINLYQSGFTGSIPQSFCSGVRTVVVDCRISTCDCCDSPLNSSNVTKICGNTIPQQAVGLDF